MHRPDRETFRRLAADHNVVPVWREILADIQTPVAAFMRLDPSPHGFLLESVEGGERWARYSFLGGDAFAVVRAKDGDVSVEGDVHLAPEPAEGPLAYVRRLLDGYRAPRMEGLPPLHGGAVGFIGYDCVRELEHLPAAPDDDLGLPDLVLLLTRTFVVFDHFTQRVFVITNVPTEGGDERYDDAVARCDATVDRLSVPLAAPGEDVVIPASVDFRPTVGDADFEDWVVAAKEHIYAGDVFQVVPSRRFEVALTGSMFDAYRALRTLNPSPYMYFLRLGEGAGQPSMEIAGSSPESLVRVMGDRIEMRPIAGTRERGADEASDRAIAEELLADEKERAEHVMLVDLARNDVGRVAEFGSVSVDELMMIERYSHVMHIVSSVSGKLAAGRTPFDAFTAAFPAGTLSGAPKVRAMQIIDSLERTRRGPYGGVVGYFDFAGNLDTCITIRTIVAAGGRAFVQAGAGIVADSVPATETEETRRKAEGVIKAAAAAGSVGS
ncbi:MAG TPA: anthranilate synthase component I [Actinomycetota bacterium]|nr:anthranilate synthase component I [Actinomycetota bacterium]